MNYYDYFLLSSNERTQCKANQKIPITVPINDIALIVLKEEITLTAEINVVTMPTAAAQYDTGTTVTVIGWGVIEDEGREKSPFLFIS